MRWNYCKAHSPTTHSRKPSTNKTYLQWAQERLSHKCVVSHLAASADANELHTIKLCLVYKNAKWVITCNSRHIISVHHKLPEIYPHSSDRPILTPPFCNQVVWMWKQLRAQFYLNISSSDIKISEIRRFLQWHYYLRYKWDNWNNIYQNMFAAPNSKAN